MFQKTRERMGWERAVPQGPVLCRKGAGDTSLLHPLGRSQNCLLLQLVQGPNSTGALRGEKKSATLKFRLPKSLELINYYLWLATLVTLAPLVTLVTLVQEGEDHLLTTHVGTRESKQL